MRKELTESEIDELKKTQHDELLSTEVYGRLSKLVKDPHNAKLLKQIAKDEKHHAHTFSKYTGKTLKVNKLKVLFYIFILQVFGFTFGSSYRKKAKKSTKNISKDHSYNF